MTAYFQEDDHYTGRLDWKLWKRIFGHAKPYARQAIGLSIAGAAVAGIDSFWPLVTGLIIDEAVDHGLTTSLWVWFGIYAGLFILFAGFVWYFIRMAGQLATGVAFDLRMRSFAKLQDLSFSYFDTRPTGWLLSRLTSDCSKISSLMPWFALDLVWGSCTIAGIVVAMLILNWKLALVVIAIVPPLVLVTWFFQKRLLESSRHIRKTNSQITASFNEAIMGVRTTKALVREEANLGEFQVLSTRMYDYTMRNALQSAVYLPMIIAIGSLGVGLALWRGGLNVGEGVTLGTLVAFMQYAGLFYMPIQELARRFTDLQAAQAAAERVQTLLDEVPAIRDSPSVEERFEIGDETPPSSIRTVTFRNLTFWYKEGEPVLRDFNLTVNAGDTIALVGPTGGGKSTIVSLAARFYEPSEGELLINGVDYRELPLNWYQQQLGVVLQTPHLFSGTVRENIRYGRLDATDQEIEHAAVIANADSFIRELDQAYESEVGEGGANLSTGQRQLVALARAVLADPQIFIMDEATSSVDTETERLIQDGIDHLLEGRIAFVIAHRLSTVRHANTILVIDGGRVVEQGNHRALMRKRGRYFTLYTRQFAREREEVMLATSMNE